MRVGVGLMALVMALAPIGPARGAVEWSPVTGEFTARYMGYDEDSPREDRNHFGEGELKIQIGAKLTDKLQLVAIPLLQYDTGGQDRRRGRVPRERAPAPGGHLPGAPPDLLRRHLRALDRQADPVLGPVAGLQADRQHQRRRLPRRADAAQGRRAGGLASAPRQGGRPARGPPLVHAEPAAAGEQPLDDPAGGRAAPDPGRHRFRAADPARARPAEGRRSRTCRPA